MTKKGDWSTHCKHGHALTLDNVVDRPTCPRSDNVCLTCERQRHKTWRSNNAGKIREYKQRYRQSEKGEAERKRQYERPCCKEAMKRFRTTSKYKSIVARYRATDKCCLQRGRQYWRNKYPELPLHHIETLAVVRLMKQKIKNFEGARQCITE